MPKNYFVRLSDLIATLVNNFDVATTVMDAVSFGLMFWGTQCLRHLSVNGILSLPLVVVSITLIQS